MKDTLLHIEALTRGSGPAAALAYALQQLALRPAFELWVCAAGLALQLQRYTDARDWLQQAHQLRPDFLPVRRQLSQVLNRIALDSEAGPARRDPLQRALELWPDNHTARFNLAQSLLEHAPEIALQHAQQLWAADPADTDAAELIALAASACGLAEPLQAVTEAMLRVQRESVLARCAGQLAWNGPPAAAAALYGRLHQARPADALLELGQQLALPACYASSKELLEVRSRFTEGLARLPERLSPARLQQAGTSLEQLSWSNFLLAYQGQNDRALQADYGHWLVDAATAVCPQADPRERPRRAGPPRIGLLSSFWRECTVGAYFGAWVGALNRSARQVWLITLDHLADEATHQLKAYASHALHLRGTLAEQAAAVAALDLDLLIYPELGMHGMTQVLAALRLARQQWCGWGHPVSCGLPSIDRQISVAGMEPPNHTEHYTEALLLLPGLGTRYVLPPRPPAAARADFGLPATGLLVVLPSSAFKLHPAGDEELAQLLAARPTASAVLLRTEAPGAMARLQQRLEAALRRAGADPVRQLHWLPALPRPRFLALLGCCDVLLDPWHWSGGNTALDALHMGLPILSRWGGLMRGRQSAAMLQQLGVAGAGMREHQRLLDDAQQRELWRTQVAQGLPQLVDGEPALRALCGAVEELVGG